MDKGKTHSEIYNTSSDTNDVLHVVIERLKSLQKYDIEPIKDYSDCWLDIDPCNDEFAKWIKVEDVEKIIKEITNAL